MAKIWAAITLNFGFLKTDVTVGNYPNLLEVLHLSKTDDHCAFYTKYLQGGHINKETTCEGTLALEVLTQMFSQSVGKESHSTVEVVRKLGNKLVDDRTKI